MPISIALTSNREIIRFIIVEKNIFYTDRKLKNYLRCLPKPDNFISQIKMSRNKIPSFLIEMFKFSDEEMKEYETAKTEEELAQIVIRDARLKNCSLLLKRELSKEELGDLKFID